MASPPRHVVEMFIPPEGRISPTLDWAKEGVSAYYIPTSWEQQGKPLQTDKCTMPGSSYKRIETLHLTTTFVIYVQFLGEWVYNYIKSVGWPNFPCTRLLVFSCKKTGGVGPWINVGETSYFFELLILLYLPGDLDFHSRKRVVSINEELDERLQRQIAFR